MGSSRSSDDSSRASTSTESSYGFSGKPENSYKDLLEYRNSPTPTLEKLSVNTTGPLYLRQNFYSGQTPTNMLNNLYAETAPGNTNLAFSDVSRVEKPSEEYLAALPLYTQIFEPQRTASLYLTPFMTPIHVSPDGYSMSSNGMSTFAKNPYAPQQEAVESYDQPPGNEYLTHSSPEHATGFSRQRRGSQMAKSSPTKRCPTCHKRLRRDLTRHMRIHEAVADFACPFPREQCTHKHGQFNRPYEFKKHLMNCHFSFDDPYAVKHAKNLSERLEFGGTCQCGFKAESVSAWIANHLKKGRCPMTPNGPQNFHNST